MHTFKLERSLTDSHFAVCAVNDCELKQSIMTINEVVSGEDLDVILEL